MDDTRDIAGQISEALSTAEQCAATDTARTYELLGEQLGKIESAAGHLLRSHVAYQPLLAKLRNGGPLAPDEVQALRSLIVGDADEVLKYDDEFDQAKRELARIMEQIRTLQSATMDIEAIKRVRVLCREASNVLAETVQYLDKKQRVRNFDDNTRSALSDEARHMLAGIVEDLATR